MLANSPDDVRALEQASTLELSCAIPEVRIVEDVAEIAPELVLADHVRGELILSGRPSEERCERVSEELR
jgi:hypothetical protein